LRPNEWILVNAMIRWLRLQLHLRCGACRIIRYRLRFQLTRIGTVDWWVDHSFVIMVFLYCTNSALAEIWALWVTRVVAYSTA
jgi:hypothetical protein